MGSISHALSMANALQWHVEESIKNSDDLPPLTNNQVRESEVARSKAMKAIKSSIKSVSRALDSVKSTHSPVKEYRSSNRNQIGQMPTKTMSKVEVVKVKPRNSSKVVDEDPNEQAALALFESLDGPRSSLNDQIAQLNGMVDRARPILDTFASALKKPYLDNYSANLSTVPVVGLKDQNVMYVEKKLGAYPGADPVDQWSVFDKVPDDFHASADKAVHLFNYGGDLFLSNGTALWKKEHISDSDKVGLAQSIDRWPKLYHDGWKKVADSVLPSNDLVSVIPFAELSADRTIAKWDLVLLDRAGKLSFYNGDELLEGIKFQPMTYKVLNDVQEPKWKQMSYWNGGICSYDDQDYTWDLTPDFSTGQYTIGGKLKVSPMTEFTADDIGPIGLQNDGWLHKRSQKLSSGSDKDVETTWTKWLAIDGVSHLGVASPGVILDLRLLTSTLRSRYLDTQSSMYGVVEALSQFGSIHEWYLEMALDKAEEFKKATEAEQKELAKAQGESYLLHAYTWSGEIRDSMFNAKEDVNIMTKQLQGVRTDLEQQLEVLKGTLTSLEGILEVEKEALSKMEAAFWGMVAAAFIGIAMVIGGVFTANPKLIVAGGLLHAAGIVAMAVLATKMAELAGEVADTENQIANCTLAIEELSAVVGDFTKLDEAYTELNSFWGKLYNDAGLIESSDKMSVRLGMKILMDPTNIEVSIKTTQIMAAAADAYLDMLNRQGIKPPTGPRAMTAASIRSQQPIADKHASSLHVKMLSKKSQIIAQLHQTLKSGDLKEYQRSLSALRIQQNKVVLSASMATTATGLWFDVAKLSSDAEPLTKRNPIGASDTKSSPLGLLIGDPFDSARDLNGQLATVKPQVVALLIQTIALGEVCQGWVKQYPSFPDQQKLPEVKEIQKKALQACSDARSSANQAMSTFADFNQAATEFEDNTRVNISATQGQVTVTGALYDSRLDHIEIPWYVWLGGPATIAIYWGVEHDRISSEKDSALASLRRAILQLELLLNSGLRVDGESATWIDMVGSVSSHLGNIYNTLLGVRGAILENPDLYREFMDIKWAQISAQAQEVLNILGARSTSTASTVRPMARIIHSSARADADTEKSRLLKAVQPSSKLGGNIASQTASLRKCFESIDRLMVLPFSQDITGYWEKEETQPETLYTVISRMRTKYTNMISMQYESIASLWTTALIQEVRAENVLLGKVKPAQFLNSTLDEIEEAYKVAQAANERFGNSAEELKVVLARIENNINMNVAKIAELNDQIDQVEEAIRDKIIALIADVIALVFATAVLLVSFGVLGPVAEAVTVATKLGLAASEAAALIAVGADSLSLSDLIKTAEALKASVSVLQSSVADMKTVQPLYRDVVDGMGSLADTMASMRDTLIATEASIHNWSAITLTDEDVEAVRTAWSAVFKDCDDWLNEVNGQGINPSRRSIMPTQRKSTGEPALDVETVNGK